MALVLYTLYTTHCTQQYFIGTSPIYTVHSTLYSSVLHCSHSRA
jgi:hypothetical protein